MAIDLGPDRARSSTAVGVSRRTPQFPLLGGIDSAAGLVDRGSGKLLGGLATFGDLCAMVLDASISTVSAIVHRRFSWSEFIEQSWFLISVSVLPTILIAIPFGLVLVLEVGGLAVQVGASSIVVAIDPIEGLVAPRLLATVVVAILLNGVVAFAGIMSGYFAAVLILHTTAGGFLNSFSSFAQPADIIESMFKAALFGLIAAVVASYQGLNAKRGPAGVGDAVNRSVVITGVILFLLNLLITDIFLVLVPPRVL